ncbi:unnamed protein product [Colias eurytheme]|nr:unnamed protein product [Colias eurytheme]
MKLYILTFSLLLVVPIWADEGLDQYYDDNDDDGDDEIYIYNEPPILGPSKISMDEIYDPNYQVNPEATLTFNYDRTRDGQSPHHVEARKESVQHYFRVRKPVPKRNTFHIRINKFDENKNQETLAKDAQLILTELEKFEKLSEKDQSIVTIPKSQTERRVSIPRPPELFIQEPISTPIFALKNDDQKMPITTTVTSENFDKIPEFIAEHSVSSQTHQPIAQETTAFPTTAQEVSRQDNLQTREQYTTTQATTSMADINKETGLINDENNAKNLQLIEFNINKNDDEKLSTSTSPPASRNIYQPRRMRHRIRKLKKIENIPQEVITERVSNNLPRNTEKYEIPIEENTQVESNNLKAEGQNESQTTETSISTSSTAPNFKNSRNFHRHWLHSRSTSKPETTSFTPTYSTTTYLPDILDTVSTPRSRRMRFRNKLRKTHRTNRRQRIEPENLSESSSQAMPSSTDVPITISSAPKTFENEHGVRDEITSQEKPKGKFSKNNPPPPLPTLSPWYDGYGK